MRNYYKYKYHFNFHLYPHINNNDIKNIKAITNMDKIF